MRDSLEVESVQYWIKTTSERKKIDNHLHKTADVIELSVAVLRHHHNSKRSYALTKEDTLRFVESLSFHDEAVSILVDLAAAALV